MKRKAYLYYYSKDEKQKSFHNVQKICNAFNLLPKTLDCGRLVWKRNDRLVVYNAINMEECGYIEREELVE